jgi:hypothetical protein
MRRLFSRNAKISLGVLPIAVGCALAKQGDPPLPVIEETAGDAGESATGGSGGSGAMTGGTGAGGSSTGGSATGGSTATGGSATGGSGGSTSTGGSAGKGGSAGSATGGSGGSTATGGSAGKGGTAGSMTGGTSGTAGGPPSGMELLRDNFETATGFWTASPAANWARAMDGAGMVYSATGSASNTNWRVAYAGEPSWTDVQVEARVRVDWIGSGSGYYGGICVRYQSEDATACFALRSNGQVMFRVNNDMNTAAANPPGGAIAENTWYNIRVVARGANITAFVNNMEIMSGSRVTSGAPAMGRIALACPGTNAMFDDVVVTTP